MKRWYKKLLIYILSGVICFSAVFGCYKKADTVKAFAVVDDIAVLLTILGACGVSLNIWEMYQTKVLDGFDESNWDWGDAIDSPADVSQEDWEHMGVLLGKWTQEELDQAKKKYQENGGGSGDEDPDDNDWQWETFKETFKKYGLKTAVSSAVATALATQIVSDGINSSIVNSGDFVDVVSADFERITGFDLQVGYPPFDSTYVSDYNFVCGYFPKQFSCYSYPDTSYGFADIDSIYLNTKKSSILTDFGSIQINYKDGSSSFLMATVSGMSAWANMSKYAGLFIVPPSLLSLFYFYFNGSYVPLDSSCSFDNLMPDNVILPSSSIDNTSSGVPQASLITDNPTIPSNDSILDYLQQLKDAIDNGLDTSPIVDDFVDSINKADSGGGSGGGSDTPPPDEPPSNDDDLKINPRDIFPFCLPWDMIALIGILKASPETPYIDIPIKISILNIDDHIIIDFAPYDYVGKFSRGLIMFIFIWGLITGWKKMIPDV